MSAFAVNSEEIFACVEEIVFRHLFYINKTEALKLFNSSSYPFFNEIKKGSIDINSVTELGADIFSSFFCKNKAVFCLMFNQGLISCQLADDDVATRYFELEFDDCRYFIDYHYAIVGNYEIKKFISPMPPFEFGDKHSAKNSVKGLMRISKKFIIDSLNKNKLQLRRTKMVAESQIDKGE